MTLSQTPESDEEGDISFPFSSTFTSGPKGAPRFPSELAPSNLLTKVTPLEETNENKLIRQTRVRYC